MKFIVKYYIIYTIDLPKNKKLKTYRHQAVKNTHKWRVTETKPDEEYTRVFPVHRKYTALLEAKEVFGFIQELSPDHIDETMGSISEYGVQPAISFSPEHEHYQENAYISPIVFNTEDKIIPVELAFSINNKIKEAVNWLRDYEVIEENYRIDLSNGDAEGPPEPPSTFETQQMGLFQC